MKNLKKFNETFENDMTPADLGNDEWKASKIYNQDLYENIPLYTDSYLKQEAHDLATKYKWEPDEMIAIAYNMFVEVNQHDLAKEFVQLLKKLNK